MSRDVFSKRDSDLLVWSGDFSTKINATPLDYSISVAQAAAFAAQQVAFAAALALAKDPQTRTRGTIESKSQHRKSLTSNGRTLVRVINAAPSTTNEMRLDLGLNPRKEEFAPERDIEEPPSLRVVSAIGRILKIKLQGLESARRGKPEGVAGATVFSFVGEEPPADVQDWQFEGSTTRTTFSVEFGPTVPAGSRVWLCAFWFSPTSRSGPACEPISAYIAGAMNTAKAA